MMRSPSRRLRLGLLLLCIAGGTRAQEPVSTPPLLAEPRPPARVPVKPPGRGPLQVALDPTAIRGNQELPKVLYIVPWKDPAMVEFAGRPANSLVEEVLAPVDREVFRRQVRYFEQLYAGGQAPAGDTPARVSSDAGVN